MERFLRKRSGIAPEFCAERERKVVINMFLEVDDYIDRMGGEWTLDYQYIRTVSKLFYADIHTKKVYQKAAEQLRSTPSAVQRGMNRVAENLWESGKALIRTDLNRPNLSYVSPLYLARWIACAAAKSKRGA